MTKVLVLGGGFAGVEAAIRLCKENCNVTLVSDRDYFYVYPTSIWIPTRGSTFDASCIDLHDLQKAHGFNLIIDGVRAIRAKANRVELDSGRVIDDYDYLVIGIGAHKMKPKGVEHTLSICGEPEMSLALRERLDELVGRGEGRIAMGFGGNPKDTSSVRGGPGFELLFNVHNMLKKKGIRDRFELTFFAPMAEPGKRLGPQALKMMDSLFSRLDIGRRVGTKINRFEADAVVFEDESRLEADLIMFIPAGMGHALIRESDLPMNEAGYVKIDDTCQVAFEEEDAPQNVYAVGDTAAIEGPEWRAKQGHIAEVMARNAAFNIVAREKQLPERKGYREHLNILCVMDSGDGAAFVYRDDKRGMMIPMPVVGHWLKKAWGHYFRLSKLGKIPRIPGM